MSLFAIADLHLSLGTDKPMDVFHGWSDYVERLKTNWERLVTDDDTVVIAGDISWAICGTRGWYYDKEGDHDMKVINREIGRLRLSYNEALKLGKPIVAFLHYPPVYGDVECEEIMAALQELGITDCWYGHLHGERTHRNAVTGMYKGIDFHLIACDYTGFTPILVR